MMLAFGVIPGGFFVIERAHRTLYRGPGIPSGPFFIGGNYVRERHCDHKAGPGGDPIVQAERTTDPPKRRRCLGAVTPMGTAHRMRGVRYFYGDGPYAYGKVLKSASR